MFTKLKFPLQFLTETTWEILVWFAKFFNELAEVQRLPLEKTLTNVVGNDTIKYVNTKSYDSA